MTTIQPNNEDENPHSKMSDTELGIALMLTEQSVSEAQSQINNGKSILRDNLRELELLRRESNIRERKREFQKWRKKVDATLDQDQEWQAWRLEFLERMKREREETKPIVGPWPGFNFVHVSRSVEDRETFFGPIHPNEVFVEIDDSWTMAQVAVHIGLFPSLTQARKNGQAGAIPSGWTDLHLGKKKIHVCILGRKPLDIPEDVD